MWLIPELHERGWEYSKYRAEEEFRKIMTTIEGVERRIVVDVQYFDETFFGVYSYNADPEADLDRYSHLITAEMLDAENDDDPYRLKLVFHDNLKLFTEEQVEEMRLVLAEALQYNIPDIVDGGILEIPDGYKIPIVQQYKALFTAYMTVEGADEDEAKEVAWDIFQDGGWSTSYLEIKQEDPGAEDWRTPILNDSQLDILLEAMDDHRYAVIDTLKDEHMGMDEQFETRKHIDEVDKIIERLKEARA